MLDWLSYEVYGRVTWLNLIVAVLIFFAGLIISRIFAVHLRRSLKDRMKKEQLEMLAKIVSYTVMVLAVIWIMPTVGIEPSGLMVAGGIVALAVGFASQSIISNLISGLFLMGERPVKIGDLVEIEGILGVVEDIHIISTSLRTLDGYFIRVPNEKVFTSSITNYSSSSVRRFEYSIGISYADDAEKAVNIIKQVIDEQPFALINPAPQVYVDSLGDNSVDIIVRIWAPTAVWFNLKMELLWKIKQAIESEGIEIPFPQRVIWYGEKGKEKAPQVNSS
ncbi:MAG: mechanosensitive ion channel family protein [Bacillota bacterium]|nr:mechanosensitive ion channel family protein [Bacillota bacterium]